MQCHRGWAVKIHKQGKNMSRTNHAMPDKLQVKIAQLRSDVRAAERALLRAKSRRAGLCHCQQRAQENSEETYEARAAVLDKLMTLARGGPFIGPAETSLPEREAKS